MSIDGTITFGELRSASHVRTTESFHSIDSWSPCEWMTAIAGEVGEAANLVKKLRRIDGEGLHAPCNAGLVRDAGGTYATPSESKRELVERHLSDRIGEELADAVIYIDLLANRLGIDLNAALVRKFNTTSLEVGSSQMLRLP